MSCLRHSRTPSCFELIETGRHGAGELDREALGALAFNDRDARRKLNRATHPAVFLELLRQLLLHWLACKWLVVRSLLVTAASSLYLHC